MSSFSVEVVTFAKKSTMSQELEPFQARILFKYILEDGSQGAEITYLYNRESLDALNIKRSTWDNSQFITIGDELTLEGKRFQVVEINFKLYEQWNKMDHGKGVNLYSPTDPTDFNCQIGVFVRRIG